MSKKSFVLFQEYKENLSILSQSQKGDLLDAIFAFNDDEEFELEPIVNMAFSFIKSDLIRNKEAWINKKEERSKSGKLGNLAKWHKDLYNQVLSGDITILEAYKIVEDRKLSLSDNSDSLKSQGIANIAVNVNGNVNVNDNVNEDVNVNKSLKKIEKKEIEIPDFIDVELWNAFLEMRIKAKAKPTQKAIELLIKKLTDFEKINQGGANKSLENSIENNWKGVFECKNRDNNPSKSNTDDRIIKSLAFLTKGTLIKKIVASGSNKAVLHFNSRDDFEKLKKLSEKTRNEIKDMINKEFGTYDFEYRY